MTVPPLSLIHVSTTSFPVTRTFYGQTFNILALMHLSDYSNVAHKYVWCNNRPVDNPMYAEQAEQLSKEIIKKQVAGILEYDAAAKEGYPSEKFLAFLKSEIDQGLFPVIYHHYPIGVGSLFIKGVHEWAESNGLRDRLLIVPYFNTLASFHSREALGQSCGNLHGSYDFAIMVSEAVNSEYSQLLCNYNLHTVLNGINMKLYAPLFHNSLAQSLLKSIGLNKNVEKIVCFVGRLSPEKGASHLLETLSYFNKNNKENKDVGFIIATSHILDTSYTPNIFQGFLRLKNLIGDDRLKFLVDVSKYTFADGSVHKEYASLLQMIAGCSIEQLPHFYEEKYNMSGIRGAFSNELLLNWPVQPLSHIALQPSQSEAFGLAIVEALASGAYVLTNDAGGIKELFSSSELGHIFNPKDPTLVSKYVEEIKTIKYENGKKNNGENNKEAKEKAMKEYLELREKFDERRMSDKVYELTMNHAKDRLNRQINRPPADGKQKSLLTLS